MAISFPLSLPSTPQFSSVTITARSVVGRATSPFTLESQFTVHQGEMWTMDVGLPPMQRAAAETWITFLVKLNGMQGTFLMGDPVGATPQGLWEGSPAVHGAGQSGKTLHINGLDPFTTGTAGDWIQLSSGAGSRLHKLMESFMADSGGEADIEIWPRLRGATPDSTALTTTAAKGVWRLSSNVREWSVREAQIFGIAFDAIEAL